MTTPSGVGLGPFRGPYSHNGDILEKVVDQIEWQSGVGYGVGLGAGALGWTLMVHTGSEEEVGYEEVCMCVFARMHEIPRVCLRSEATNGASGSRPGWA